MQHAFWIGLAGAAGTATRYAIATWSAQRLGSAFPYGTLIVNVSGSFAIAAVMHLALSLGWPAMIRAAITVGFLGGFTTYSSFNYETMRLLDEGASLSAATNTAATVLGGWTAGWLGLLVGRALLGR